MDSLSLEVMPGFYRVLRLDAEAPFPAEAVSLARTRGRFVSASFTPEEVSLVVPDDSSGPEGRMQLFRVAGTLDFSLTGILVSIAKPLADARISIFAVSTFDTDYFLVAEKDFDRAIEVLRRAGFAVGSIE